jgi:hypothetical protein
MEPVPEPRIVKLPTDEETKSAFEVYTLALGKVAHAWNYLHEKLAQLFCVITESERAISLAIWYSTTNERAQRDMLKAAVAAVNLERWEKLPKAKEDLKWCLDKVDVLAGHRNNAVHAPCSLYIGGGNDGGSEMGAAFFQGHPRAKELQGKKVLIEFDWCERYAETLTRFAQKLESAIAHPRTVPLAESAFIAQSPSKILAPFSVHNSKIMQRADCRFASNASCEFHPIWTCRRGCGQAALSHPP